MPETDALADRVMATVTFLARQGGRIVRWVAIVAAVVVGGAYLVGLAAFDGGGRTVWAAIGGLFLIVAVGGPLLALFRLSAIPRKASALTSELRTLLGGTAEAERVVIEVVEADERDGSTSAPALVGSYQRFTGLRDLARTKGVHTLAAVIQSLTAIPRMLLTTLLLTIFSAFAGFVFFLIWIF